MEEKLKILASKGITYSTEHHHYPYLFQSMLEAMEEYSQHQAEEEV